MYRKVAAVTTVVITVAPKQAATKASHSVAMRSTCVMIATTAGIKSNIKCANKWLVSLPIGLGTRPTTNNANNNKTKPMSAPGTGIFNHAERLFPASNNATSAVKDQIIAALFHPVQVASALTDAQSPLPSHPAPEQTL